MSVKVISLFEKETDPNGIYINTTSRAPTSWETDLSPFYLGPCPLYAGHISLNMENAWQFSKIYPEFADLSVDRNPTTDYWEWAWNGWNDKKAHRYPMGKGRKPLYSYWNGKKYGYVEARKKIYIPLYVRSVIKTPGFQDLKDIHQDLCAMNQSETNPSKKGTIYLKDYDAYRHEEKGLTLTDVVNNPNKKCGHAFVLMMLLTQDPILKECQLPPS